MKYTQINRFVAFVVILASTATAAYFPGGLLAAKYTSFDKRTIPAADSDGICYTYTVEAGETCASIAKAFGITVAEIEKYNSDVYAWYGCDDLYQGAFICLSTGSPTMPVALPHAICGPQVPGTIRPADMSKSNLASLKPCAWDHCCSINGQCGTTSGYCSSSKCISNCNAEAASAATTKKSSSKSSTSTTSTKSTTTSSRSTSTTSAKSSTSSMKEKETSTSTTSAASSTETWSISIYDKSSCDAGGTGYYVVGGFNINSKSKCLTLSGGDMTTDDSGPDPWCQWYSGEGDDGYTSCGSSKLTVPGSYYISAGQCWTYSDDACQDSSGEIYNPNIGCQYWLKTSWNPKTIGSMECTYIP
ncbi:uncharacterized protein N7503_009692 [Penicillium pulvis]|uniref:uncharacterized protein n=1 Tax=Penicillium pulvis TaxID=1562058 RepID=UPI002547F440|nr:uncharacterized protein N7503_009692 [Penicillium pulvis]KAJ5784480.1 hypothetical protein N7503_009692 [Penicillium pulvis]